MLTWAGSQLGNAWKTFRSACSSDKDDLLWLTLKCQRGLRARAQGCTRQVHDHSAKITERACPPDKESLASPCHLRAGPYTIRPSCWMRLTWNPMPFETVLVYWKPRSLAREESQGQATVVKFVHFSFLLQFIFSEQFNEDSRGKH